MHNYRAYEVRWESVPCLRHGYAMYLPMSHLYKKEGNCTIFGQWVEFVDIGELAGLRGVEWGIQFR